MSESLVTQLILFPGLTQNTPGMESHNRGTALTFSFYKVYIEVSNHAYLVHTKF